MQPEETPNLPALVPLPPPLPGPPPPAVVNPFDTDGLPPYFTNIDTRSRDGRAMVMMAMREPSLTVDDMLGKPFRVTHALAHPIELENEEGGELQTLVRIVFLTEDKKTLACVSAGVFKYLRIAVSLYGPGPWSPPLTCTIRQQKTRKGRRLYVLDAEQEDGPGPISSTKKGK